MNTLRDVVEKPFEFVRKLANQITGWYRLVNNEYFPEFVNEVRGDIESLKEFMDLAKFERDKEPHYQHLVRKYEQNYCPSTLNKRFSHQNQLEYLYLRNQIDDILTQKDNPFSDFLSNFSLDF